MVDSNITKSVNFFAKRSLKSLKEISKLAIFCWLVFSCEENALAMVKMEQNEVEKNEKIENKIKNTGEIFFEIFPKEIDNLILSFSPKREKHEIKHVNKNIEFQEIVRFFHNSNAFNEKDKVMKFSYEKDRKNAFNFTRRELKKQIEKEFSYISLNTFATEKTLIAINKDKKESKLSDISNSLSENIDIKNLKKYEKIITIDKLFQSQAEFLFGLFFYQETKGSQYKQLMLLPLSVSKEKDFAKVEKLLEFFQRKLNSSKKNGNILKNRDSLSFDFIIKLDFEVDIKFLKEKEFGKKYKKNILGLKLKYPITDKDLKTFSEMKFVNLRWFDLSGIFGNQMQITNAGLAYLKDLSNLQALNLSYCEKITGAGLENLNGLKNLQALNLSSCEKITDAGLAHLQGLVNLRELNLSSCEITDAGLAHLQGLVNLRELNLFWCKEITDTGLAYLQGLKNLRMLGLRYCSKIKDDGLAHLKGLKNLQALDLTWAQYITNEGLAHLKELKNLRTLNLTCCKKITNAGLANLQELKNLQALDLSGDWDGNFVTDAGLANLKELKNLQVLVLRDCKKITNAGLAHLQELKNLQELVLHGCKKITYTGLSQLKDLKNLKTLDLQKCKEITKIEKEMLKKAIPGLKIID